MMSQDPNMNPYAGGDFSPNAMPTPQGSGDSEVTSVPQWIGILNIVFGSLLLLCLLGYGLQILMQGIFGSAMVENQEKMQARMEQDREAQIEELIEAEEAAEDEETAIQWRVEREKLQQQPIPKMPDMQNLMGMKDPAVIGSYIFDAGTGILLNVLMIAAGIGLISKRAWGRKLGVWVAGLKIIRLVIVALLTILVISPALSDGMGTFVAEMGQMNQHAPPNAQPSAEQLQMIYAIMFAVWAAVLLLLGSIYPIVCLRLLTRPRVINACKETKAETFRPEVF